MGSIYKAQKRGWEALIPGHNIFTLIELSGKPGWWIFLYLIPIVNIVVHVKILHGFSKKFGHGTGFTVGLFFLHTLFMLILAFGSSEYLGDKKESIKDNNDDNQNDNTASEPTKKITNKVAQVENDSPAEEANEKPAKIKQTVIKSEDKIENSKKEQVKEDKPKVQKKKTAVTKNTNKSNNDKGISSATMRLIFIIMAGVALLFAIVAVSYTIWFSGDKNDTNSAEEMYYEEIVDDTYSDDGADMIEEQKEEVVKTKPVVNSGQGKLNLSYANYVGDIKNGQANGQGKMTYKKQTRISKYDRDKRYAEPGQYIIGTWYSNKLDFGKLYDKNGVLISTITIGRAE